MLDEQATYEAGMEEGEYLASLTDVLCRCCKRPLYGWEVENGRDECQDCDPPEYEPTSAEVDAAGEWESYPF